MKTMDYTKMDTLLLLDVGDWSQLIAYYTAPDVLLESEEGEK